MNQVYGGTCGFNTATCTCNEIDGVMTTRYCNDDENGCGPIPPALGMCSNLLHLTLSQGRLSGSIPNALTQLVNVLTFDVSNNNLTGELPNDIGILVNLTKLDVSNNQLSGPISAPLPTRLEYLYLDNNRFEGTIHSDIFSNLTSLKELYLSFNMFQGAVPYLNNHNSLESIMFHSNNFNMIRSDTFSGTASLQYVINSITPHTSETDLHDDTQQIPKSIQTKQLRNHAGSLRFPQRTLRC